MRRLYAVLLLSVFAPLLVQATPPSPPREFPEWQWRAKVVSGTSIQSDYVMLELPAEVFSGLKPDLADLRVGAHGRGEVPYVLSVEREADASSRLPTRMFNLSSTGAETTFILDLGRSGVFHDAVTIETTSENFRRIVEIQGSDDQRTWRTLNPRGQIFDYTVRDIKPVAVRDTNVSYPDATFRFLLVRILNQGEAPLRITGATVSRQVARPAREVSYVPAIAVSENSEERSTDVVADLGAPGIPHRRARLASPAVNFNRAVEIYDSEDREEWRLLATGYLFSIQTDRFTGSNFELPYSESNRRYLKFSILNRDDAPVQIQGVTVFGVVRSILFPYEVNGGEYHLYFGNPDARRPQYDIEQISQYVDTATLDRVSVGPTEENPSYEAPVSSKPPLTERSPYILPVMLGALVAVLAFLLLRVIGRAKAMPPPAGP